MNFTGRTPPVVYNQILFGVTLAMGSGVSSVEAQSGNQTAPEEEVTVDLDAVFQVGKSLFEDYAPEEVKAQFRFPSREEFDDFSGRLQQALQNGSLEELVSYKTEAQAALIALRTLPDYAPYADWLQERLDYIDAAEAIIEQTPPSAPIPNSTPAPRRAQPAGEAMIPHYDLWISRMRQRPAPAFAARYVPGLKPIFTQAGTPGELVWLAEVESSFRSDARSPVGAHGLFQFMPGTATDMGLSLRPFDERADPRKSAQAAARYLRQLRTQFGSWSLALAAYNAGPGRVGRLLKSQRATSYAAIASALPSETRMYVPKVMATIAVRTGLAPAELEDR
jgi:membrane-bound lytic murein transglycosylase D